MNHKTIMVSHDMRKKVQDVDPTGELNSFYLHKLKNLQENATNHSKKLHKRRSEKSSATK